MAELKAHWLERHAGFRATMDFGSRSIRIKPTFNRWKAAHESLEPMAISHMQNPSGDEWFESLGRVGFATKGVVYTIVGIMAFRVAARAGGSTEGARGAILEIADQPFGEVLLILTGIGLFAYASWRFIEAGVGLQRSRGDVKRLAKRLGYAVSGLIYLGLAIWCVRIVLGGSASDEGDSGQGWTAWLLSQPFGKEMVGIAGAAVIGVGLHQLRQAIDARFLKRYGGADMDPEQRQWVRRVGRIGLSARAVTFSIIGGFLIRAAIQSDPSETRGLGGALQTLAEQPYGPWLLGAVALGFISFGLHCFAMARYRRFSLP